MNTAAALVISHFPYYLFCFYLYFEARTLRIRFERILKEMED